jgi:membrane-bound lytic murein transglycosylase A
LPATPPPPAALPLLPAQPLAAIIEQPRSRWVAADWTDLPGLADDNLLQAWPALQAGCARPARGWADVCARALLQAPTDEAAARRFLRTHLRPYRVETPDGSGAGLITGYFEPLVDAVRLRDAAHRVPLYALPPDAADRRWTRRQLDTLPAARAALRGLEIAWVAEPLDALLLQIQGSGRLRLAAADSSAAIVRLAFAGHNEQPYKSVGRWLVEQGELTADSASWPAIKTWAQANPKRADEMLWANPRVVFFREEALPDPDAGPRGAMGVALTPGRSIAVDPQSLPFGSWVWIDTTEPLSNTPLRRLVGAQDTGGAITGAVRADFFWGWGDAAEAQAGRMKQPLRMWVLLPT